MFLTAHRRVFPSSSILPVHWRRARSKRKRAQAKNFPALEGLFDATPWGPGCLSTAMAENAIKQPSAGNTAFLSVCKSNLA